MTIKPGYQWGRLTVASDAGLRKNRYMVWNCTCDCGRTVQLDSRAIKRGLICDCGCMTRVRPGQKDLTGNRYGKLVALEPTEHRDQNGVIVWRCRCDCGKEKEVSAAKLKNGYTKSCGCLKPAVEVSAGNQYGRLTVLEAAETRNGMRYWKCRCSCGNIAEVRQAYLVNGKTASCGCLHDENFRMKMGFVEGTSVKFLENAPERLNSNNASGYNGIYLNKKNQKWIAQITFKKKTYYLGSYAELSGAVEARKAAEERIYGDFLAWYNKQQKSD